MPDVLILTGPPGAGKSTVADALAERYDRVAHIDVAALRNFVAPTGRGPSEIRDRLFDLGVRNACAVALNFLSERIAVIIDDLVTTPEHLTGYVEGLKPARDAIHFVRLMPSLDVCQARNVERPEGRQAPSRVETVWRQFEAAGAFAGTTIDSSELSAYETADRLQALTTSGQSIVWRPGE
jgi:chloramphenicol 3-O-phosphotransferase